MVNGPLGGNDGYRSGSVEFGASHVAVYISEFRQGERGVC
jgi:hypothetical protein